MWNNNHYEWNIDLNWLEQEAQYHPSVVLSHQPPYSGTLTEEQENRWYKIRHSSGVVASIHGHMHKFNHTYEDGLPIFTVERVENSAYGIGTFDIIKEFTFKEVKP
jgi:calcineurin-like phosphoesterase family protein